MLTTFRFADAVELSFPTGTANSYPQLNDILIPSTVSLNLFLFSADEGIHGREPWIYDVQSKSSRLLKDIAEGKAGSFPKLFTAILSSANTLQGYVFATSDFDLNKDSLWFARIIDEHSFDEPQPFSLTKMLISEIVFFPPDLIFIAAADSTVTNPQSRLFCCNISTHSCDLVDASVEGGVSQLTTFPGVGVFFQHSNSAVRLGAVLSSDKFQLIRFLSLQPERPVFEFSNFVFDRKNFLWFSFVFQPSAEASNMHVIGRANGSSFEYFPSTECSNQLSDLTVVKDRLYFIRDNAVGSLALTGENQQNQTTLNVPRPIRFVASGQIFFIVAYENTAGSNDAVFYSYDGSNLKSFPSNISSPDLASVRGRPFQTNDGEVFVLAEGRKFSSLAKETQVLFYHGTKDQFVEFDIMVPSETVTSGGAMAIAGSHIFLQGHLPGFGVELLEWNGTTLTLTDDINKEPVSPQVSEMVLFQGNLYFSAWTPQTGNELFVWFTSLSLAADLIPGPVSSFPRKMIVCHEKLYLLAFGITPETNEISLHLWRTGDQQQFQSYPLSSSNAFLTCMDEKLIYSNSSEIRYFSDQATPPNLVNTLENGSSILDPISPPLEGKLYFFSQDEREGLQLRSTDLRIAQVVGTIPSTMSLMSEFLTFNQSLYFMTLDYNTWSYHLLQYSQSGGNPITQTDVYCPGIVPENIISSPDYLFAINKSSYLTLIDGSQYPPSFLLNPPVNFIRPLGLSYILACNGEMCSVRNRSIPFDIIKEFSNCDTDVNPQIWYDLNALIPKANMSTLSFYRIHMRPGEPKPVNLSEVKLPYGGGRVTLMRLGGDQLFVESYVEENRQRRTFMIPVHDLLSDDMDSQSSKSQESNSQLSNSQTANSQLSNSQTATSQLSNSQLSNSEQFSSFQDSNAKSSSEGAAFLKIAAGVGVGVGMLLLLFCCIALAIVVILVCITAFCLRMKKRTSKNEEHNPALELPESNSSSQASTVRSTSALAELSNSSSSSKAQITISIDTSKWTDINMQEIEIISRLGTGAYGIVYKAKYRSDFVALKKLKDMDSYAEQEEMNNVIQEFTREITILAQLRHVNVLFFYGACTSFPNLAIVTEFMEKGSLYDLMYKVKESLPFLTRISIAFDIAKGVSYLHSQQIIHRDLKSHNCLISKNYVAKVADFGMSRIRDAADRHSMTSNVGSVLWMAPEVALGEKYDSQVDVFSFGIILSELITMRVPYSDMDQQTQQMIHFKIATRDTLRPTIPESEQIFQEAMTLLNKEISEPAREAYNKVINDFIALMTKCWRRDPNERPTFSEIVPSLDSQYSSIANL